MRPLAEYLMPREAEITLARSAAPPAIAQDASVLVLAAHGYETAVTGKNGFVCVVQRSWTDDRDDPEFWNPKARAPICYNAAAARSYLPLITRKTELALAGRTEAEIFSATTAALERKELPAIETGAMCYMLSRQGHLNDRAGHWHPHLMFFYPLTDSAAWGAGVEGAPLYVDNAQADRVTTVMVPVSHWSDGTPDDAAH